MITKAEKTGINKMKVGDKITTGKNMYHYAYHWCLNRNLKWKFKSKKDIDGNYTLKRIS